MRFLSQQRASWRSSAAGVAVLVAAAVGVWLNPWILESAEGRAKLAGELAVAVGLIVAGDANGGRRAE